MRGESAPRRDCGGELHPLRDPFVCGYGRLQPTVGRGTRTVEIPRCQGTLGHQEPDVITPRLHPIGGLQEDHRPRRGRVDRADQQRVDDPRVVDTGLGREQRGVGGELGRTQSDDDRVAS